jgi:broad specificity phosphatase PhoE
LTGSNRSGEIVIVRHGKPVLDRDAGPRLDWQAYRDWWSRYEQSSLREDQRPPERLLAVAARGTLFLSSTRPRAMQTADAIAGGADVTRDPVFIEAPLPPPILPGWIRFLPRMWNMLARAAWLGGHSLDGESVSQARQRAKRAARVLSEHADQGQIVVLAAHGWFNRMMRPPLLSMGWRCVHDGGDSYWSYRVYRRKA